MTKSLIVSTTLAVVLGIPAGAAAQSAPASGDGSCPPGSWFCAQAPQQQAAPAGQPVEPLDALPEPDEPVPPRRPAETRRPQRQSAAPAIQYPPPPPPVFERSDAPPRYEYVRPRPEPLSRSHEWGLNLHLEGAMIGSGSQGNAGLGGGGGGLRFKPIRSFGVEADLDFAGGNHDYQGNRRSETAITLNGLIFLNPRSHAQIYLLAGLGGSGANVTCNGCATPAEAHYRYFGGQVGLGLELRLARFIAFDLDARAFIRSRTDALAQTQPEFDEPAGCSANPTANPSCRTSNTSGGGLFTGGMTLYF